MQDPVDHLQECGPVKAVRDYLSYQRSPLKGVDHSVIADDAP